MSKCHVYLFAIKIHHHTIIPQYLHQRLPHGCVEIKVLYEYIDSRRFAAWVSGDQNFIQYHEIRKGSTESFTEESIKLISNK